MLNIRIDNPGLEKSLRQSFGDDTPAIAGAFSRFIQLQGIRQDIGVSIEQLESGDAVLLADVFKGIRTKFE